jgi:hypothetical protein
VAKKLTLCEIVNKLRTINENIEIIDTEYLGNKIPLLCKCKKCEHKWKAKWNNLSSNNSGCPNCYYNSRFIDDQSIRNFASEVNYTLFNIKRNGTKTRIVVSCENNHNYETSWKAFQNGRRCRKCASIENGKKKLNDINEIRKLMESYSFEVLDTIEYTGKSDRLEFQCEVGHKFVSSYESMRKSKKCPICEYGRESFLYSYDDVKQYFESQNCKLLESEYINSHTKMKYLCSCNNTSHIRFGDFIRGVRCIGCQGNVRWNIELINEKFRERGLELLSNHYIPGEKLKYVCKNGHEAQINIHDFLSGRECIYCTIVNRSGENSPNWNPNLTDEEREKNRKYPEYKSWRLAVYQRDSYTCQCCGDNKGHNLNAHHLNSHDWAIDQRLDLDNAVTLCDLCHTDFHNLYGYGDNTKEQYEEYIEELYNNAI